MAAILVVDDDQVIRDVLYDLFTEQEHSCHLAKSAEEALEWMKTEAFDVILTDISMPGLSGVELMSRIHQQQPDTPVIIISVIDYQQFSGDLLRMGAFDYLVKPFELKDVEESVNRALAHRRDLLEEG